MLFGFYSPVWALLVVATMFAAAATPLFRWADAKASTTPREVPVDGIRGFLAISVFLHHAAIYQRYAGGGVWAEPPATFYASAGPVGVAIFFAITAYLFWGRVLSGRMDWLGFYIGRVFRIGPLYLVAIAAVLAITLAVTGSLEILPTIQWLGLGALGAPAMNDYEPKRILAGVTWTLLWEWRFYVVLFPLAFFRRLHWLVGGLGLAGSLVLLTLHPSPSVSIPALGGFFSVGMLCASAKHSGFVLPLPRWALSIAALGALLTALFLIPSNYSVAGVLLAGVAFFAVEGGGDVFGLLTQRASIRLGNLSYGIYLLHGLVLFAVFSAPGAGAFALSSPAHYWVTMTFAGLAVATLALALHRPVELAGIEAGRKVASWARTVLAPRPKPAPQPV
jgi:peptidoglycan/LPS O-acetylase OafA/YrhL